MTKLHAYQETVAQFLDDRWDDDGAAALFLEMGLGKTLITLEVLRRRAWPTTLLIAPRRVVDQVWRQEAEKHGYRCRITEFPEIGDITLISVDSLHKLQYYDSLEWDAVVIDESTRLKNPRTKRFRALRKFVPKCKWRVILTGTPTPNSLMDLWSQFYLIDGGARLEKTIGKFRAAYCEQGGFRGKEWKLRPGSEDLIRAAVQDCTMEMQASAHLPGLPTLVEQPIWVSLPSAAQAEHDRMKKQLVAEISGEQVLAPNAAAAVTKCRQIANGFVYDEDTVRPVHSEKQTALAELAQGLVGQQAVVVYPYQHDLDAIREAVGPVATLDNVGDWANGGRQFLAFQEQSGSFGLNLQGSDRSHVIFYGTGYSSETYLQAVARLRRQGGADNVIVHRIMAKDTIDVLIAKCVEGKVQHQSDFLAELRKWAAK